MAILALKLLLSPSLVLAAWWLARRFGPAVGGRAAALPIVAGPILLVLALVHGPEFARRTAQYALLGITPLAGFGIAYSWAVRWGAPTSSRHPRLISAVRSLLLGWGLFLLTAGALRLLVDEGEIASPAPLPLALCVAAAALTLALAPRCIARTIADRLPGRAHSIRREIAGRALGAMVLVAALTTASAALGPVWSGLLASFPVAFSVVLVASHLCDGADAVRPVVHGYMAGLWGYLASLLVFALLLPRIGLAAAVTLSWLSAPAVQWGHHRWIASRRARARPGRT